MTLCGQLRQSSSENIQFETENMGIKMKLVYDLKYVKIKCL